MKAHYLILLFLAFILTACVRAQSYYTPSDDHPKRAYIDGSDNLIIQFKDNWDEIPLQYYIGKHGEPGLPGLHKEIFAEDRTTEYAGFTTGTPDEGDLVSFNEIQVSNKEVYAASLNSLGYFSINNVEVKVKESTLFHARTGGPKLLGYILVKPTGEYAFFYIEQEKHSYLHSGLWFD